MIALFRKYLLASLILYVFCIDAAFALPAHKFTQYTSEDGLEEYVVQNILQDHQGLMWFATWDGLYNYDGYKFRRFEAGSNGIKPSHSRLDQLAEQLGIVSSNATKMSHLVSQILDFRKIQNGKMTLSVENFDFVPFVARQVDDFRLLAQT